MGKRQLEDNAIDITDLDQKIYRIFSIQRFKELLSTNELVLMNPQKWDDPFENFFLRANAVDERGQTVYLSDLAKKWYGQCWSFTSESDAMWRIYSPKKDGVRVSTTVRKLFSALWENNDGFGGLRYFIGKVDYWKRAEIESFMRNHSFLDISIGGQNDKFAKLLCIKRTEFAHEAEVRLLANDSDGSIGSNGFYRKSFDYKKTFEDVCLDPRLDDADYQKVKNEFEALGCTLSISQSELYKVSFSPIRLS
jgi:hypothetical protein